jgi:hypothetical protein
MSDVKTIPAPDNRTNQDDFKTHFNFPSSSMPIKHMGTEMGIGNLVIKPPEALSVAGLL